MTSNTATAAPAASIDSTTQEYAERDLLRWLGFLMALVGVGISGYLAYVKLADTEAICVATETIDCAGVQNSVYGEIMGIPISFLGLGAYLFIAALFFLEDRLTLVADYSRTLLFSTTLFGFVYSGYLTYIEGFVLHKWCLWCVASAVLMTGLFALSSVRLMRGFDDFDDDEFEDDDEA